MAKKPKLAVVKNDTPETKEDKAKRFLKALTGPGRPRPERVWTNEDITEQIITLIAEKDYIAAQDLIKKGLNEVMMQKLYEAKKQTAARMQ